MAGYTRKMVGVGSLTHVIWSGLSDADKTGDAYPSQGGTDKTVQQFGTWDGDDALLWEGSLDEDGVNFFLLRDYFQNDLSFVGADGAAVAEGPLWWIRPRISGTTGATTAVTAVMMLRGT